MLLSPCHPLSGKVSIKKEDLCNYTGKENWFMLQPVDSNSEVQVTIELHIYILKVKYRLGHAVVEDYVEL